MSYTEQLEREAEQRRLHLSANLDELRDRLSPAQVVDQLMDYVQNGSGGQFFHNLKRQVVGNPLPVTLIGAGVAWLVMARRNGDGHAPNRSWRSAQDGVAKARSDMSAKMDAAGSRLSDGAAAARARLEEGRERLDDAVQSARETADETYSEVYNAATGAYERIRHLGRGTVQTGHSIAEFCRDQPLVVAGIGLAIGAALGAALPATELENRMMGDASEDAKRQMREIASDAAEKAQAVGERAIGAAGQAAFEEAEAQGLTETGTEDTRTADAATTGDVPSAGDTVTVVPEPDPTQQSDNQVPRSG
jgi:hypothetical protein